MRAVERDRPSSPVLDSGCRTGAHLDRMVSTDPPSPASSRAVADQGLTRPSTGYGLRMEWLTGLDLTFRYAESLNVLCPCTVTEPERSAAPGGYSGDRFHEQSALRAS